MHRPNGEGGVENASGFPLSSYKADVGLGLDAEVLGVFVAKSVTDWKNPVNVVVRLRHRF